MATRTQTAAARKRAETAPVKAGDKPSRVLARRSVGTEKLPVNLDTATSYEELVAQLQAAGVTVPSIEGSAKMVKCEDLEGVPFVAVDWSKVESDKYSNPDGSPAVFVAVTVVAEKLGRVVFTTGAYGIVKVIENATEQGLALFSAPNGLTRSEFVTTGARGEKIEATSWWLN